MIDLILISFSAGLVVTGLLLVPDVHALRRARLVLRRKAGARNHQRGLQWSARSARAPSPQVALAGGSARRGVAWRHTAPSAHPRVARPGWSAFAPSSDAFG